MDETHSPELARFDGRNVNDLLAERVRLTPERTLIERRSSPDEPWQPLTAAGFDAEVVAAAKGLVAHGVQPGDRVAIMSRTRYEWSLLDWACWAAAAIPVPIYETSSAEQVHRILTDAGVSVVVVESSAHAETVASVSADTPDVREVLVIDDGAIDRLVADGAATENAEIARRRGLAELDDVATIIYTSGTTGQPKGSELTHRNFAYLTVNTVIAVDEIVNEPGARTLLFLPMAHVFARFIAVLCVPAGIALGHSPDTRTLLADLGSFQPTFLLAVPRVFEKVYNSSEQKAAAGGKIKIFHWAAATSIAYSRALDTPSGPSAWLRVQHRLAHALVLSKLRAAMGGRVSWAISGGAPLGERLGHFYRGLGLRVLEGYGLTETTAPATVNRPTATKIGTVGPPMPGTAVRVTDDGEVWLRGPHIFRGYHDNPAATAEVMTDGWFRTGDLGQLDDDGFLRITGRSKEIIVTAGGKNVAPALLEDRLRAHALVSQVVVVGDAKPYIAALVTLDPEGLTGWLAAHGREPLDVAAASTDPQVLASLDRAVGRANRAVSRAESIKRYRILDKDLTIEDGYLTPKLSIRRAEVLKDFAHEIETMYTDGEGRSVGTAD